jgi:formate hydrogenlyase subunit 6/NADH:ubiquinone oxidoreductase subunit I
MNNPIKLPMAAAALKNLFLPPATRRHPVEKRAPFPGARGQLVLDRETCNYCGLCARRCPCAALVVSTKEKTFAIEHLRCVSCGVCVDACNKDSLSLASEALPVQRAGCKEHRHGEPDHP